MISYSTYRVLHFVSIFMIFLTLGAAFLQGALGLTQDHPWRKMLAITHGVGMLGALVAGFGLLARLGQTPSSGWVMGKVLIWLAIGAVFGMVRKRPQLAKALWWPVILLGAVAAYLAGSKPF
jgi:hypothetical protein